MWFVYILNFLKKKRRENIKKEKNVKILTYYIFYIKYIFTKILFFFVFQKNKKIYIKN